MFLKAEIKEKKVAVFSSNLFSYLNHLYRQHIAHLIPPFS